MEMSQAIREMCIDTVLRTVPRVCNRESCVVDVFLTGGYCVLLTGSRPASGTGTLVIHLEDYNDNAPYVHPSVVRVCEDTKDSVVIVGGRDRDIHPNAGPFKIELGKQPGLEKTWKVSRVNSEFRL